MGGSSSRTFFGQKKRSPLDRVAKKLKGLRPKKKRKKSLVDKLNLDGLRKNKKKKKTKSSFGKKPKGSIQEGFGKLGDQIKRKLSKDQSDATRGSGKMKEKKTDEDVSPRSGGKLSGKKLMG